MRTHGDDDQQIARRAAVPAGVALPAQGDGLPVVNARGDGDLERLAAAELAAAVTGLAGLVDDPALAAAAPAGRGGGHETERRLAALLHHAGAAAVGTDLGGRALFAAGAAAGVALLDALDADLLFAAEGSLLKADGDARAQALTALRRVGIRPCAAEAAAEKAAEDVAEVAEVEAARAVGSAARTRAVVRVYAGKAELVVARLLLGIGEHLVGLVDLLELLLGFLVAGVHVGVVLARQLFVCFFDLFLGSALGDAEDLIIVSFILSHRLCS